MHTSMYVFKLNLSVMLILGRIFSKMYHEVSYLGCSSALGKKKGKQYTIMWILLKTTSGQ